MEDVKKWDNLVQKQDNFSLEYLTKQLSIQDLNYNLATYSQSD